jgi:hypothetical protein
MSQRRLITFVVGAILTLLIVIILAFSSLLADPTSGSGEGDIRPPTTTTR